MVKDLFNSLDLNLLRVFQIIYQERNLGKAANRLFVTQPAVSKSLAKLRHHFNDDLFIRSYQGMLATDLSDNLYRALGPAITQLNEAINVTTEFDPAELNGQLRICISPFLIHAFGDKIYQSIHEQAPNVQLILLNWSAKTLSHINNQEVDLGINYVVKSTFQDVSNQIIGRDEYSLYVRAEHPFLKESISTEEISKHEIMTLIDADWNFNQSLMEKELTKRGLPTNIVFRSELPSVIINALLNSDAMFPSSKYLKHNDSSNLRKIDIGVESDLNDFPIMAYFHKKQALTKKQAWLIGHFTTLLI